MKLIKTSLTIGLCSLSLQTSADEVVSDDLIVQSNICSGLTCLDGEDFGDSQLLLKDTLIRVTFEDVSSGAFPSNDWEIRINDTFSGGEDYFAIRDVTNNLPAFRIEAGGSGPKLWLDNQGYAGFGTANPQADIHINRVGDTPTLRFEELAPTVFFTLQEWETGGDEDHFFIRDVSNGNSLPFRIKPGLFSNTLVVDNGKVGVGTFEPAESLHVLGRNGVTKLLVEEISPAATPRTLMELRNSGNTKFSLINTFDDVEWSFANPGNSFRISRQGSGQVEFDLNNDGDLEIAGFLTENSDRNAKANIEAINVQDVLHKVAALPISEWSYKESLEQRHIGPMAQDFYAAFGLGASDTGIATLDTTGVALAAIQALFAKNQKLTAEIHTLKAQLKENQLLESRLDAQDQEIKVIKTALQQLQQHAPLLIANQQ